MRSRLFVATVGSILSLATAAVVAFVLSTRSGWYPQWMLRELGATFLIPATAMASLCLVTAWRTRSQILWHQLRRSQSRLTRLAMIWAAIPWATVVIPLAFVRSTGIEIAFPRAHPMMAFGTVALAAAVTLGVLLAEWRGPMGSRQ